MTTTSEERNYAIGVLAAAGAQRPHGLAELCEQAREVLAKETPEAEAQRLRDQLHDCEMSLNIFDDGRSSEYWLRHAVQPSNE